MMASSSRISISISRALSELPVGFRFHPTEEELVRNYLEIKLQGNDDLVSQVIPEIDICKYEPWKLPDYSLIKSDDDKWFFFSRPDFKHNNRNRSNRATKEGFWKITAKEREIKTRDNRTVIGKMRTMTFYIGRVRKARKTNWVIHEYYIPDPHPNTKKRDFVLCRLKKKSDENIDVATCDEGEPNNASDIENQTPTHDMDIQEEDTRAPENLDIFEMAGDRMLANALSSNVGHGFQSEFGANEPDDDCTEFADSLIVDHDQDLFEEATPTTLLNDSTLPQSLRRVYVADGGSTTHTDTEPVHEVMYLQFSELPVGSSYSRQDKDVMVRHQFPAASSTNVSPTPQTNRLQLVTQEHPTTYEGRTRIPESRPISVSKDGSVDTSSLGAYIPEINCLDLVNFDYYTNERTRRRSYSQGAPTALGKLREQQSKAREPNLQKSKVPEPKMQQIKAKEAVERQAAVSVPPKMTFTTKSSIDKNVAPGNNAEEGMKQTQNATTTSNLKGSFISWQTSPLTSPPSVYIFNTVVGTILFMIFARELVLYGQWC